jgi:hypothetical protein
MIKKIILVALMFYHGIANGKDVDISIKSLITIDGSLHLVILVKNLKDDSLLLTTENLNKISDNISVKRHDGSQEWGNFSSTPILNEDDKKTGVTIGGSKIMYLLISAPPSSIFSVSDFDEKIKFNHSLINVESPIFRIRRVKGGDIVVTDAR